MMLIIAILLSYTAGSLPTAYILVKRFYGVDVRRTGSGNVGGRNSYEITGNRALGVVVSLIDAMKGAAAVVIAIYLSDGSFIAIAACTAGALLGHNFSIWIGFRGGRGLATAGGALLLTYPAVAVLWCLVWVLVSFVQQEVVAGNMITSAIVEVLLFVVPSQWLLAFSFAAPERFYQFQLYVTVLLIVIFVSHLRGRFFERAQ